jgi:hypothetical protein
VYIEDREVAVVAPAPEEIDIVPATPDEARAALGGTRISDENAHAAAVESQFAAGAAGGMRPRELWPVLALVLFTVVLVESLLASRSPST